MSTRRTLIAGMAAVTLVMPAAALAASPHRATAPTWAATATRALPLSSHALGALPGDRRLRISVGLAVRNPGAMARLATAMSTPGSAAFGKFLSPRQVQRRFGPTTATVDTVTQWLSASGFHAVTPAPNGLLIDAVAPVRTVERTFHTTLVRYRLHGQVLFSNATAAMVPADLAGKVVSVLGLNDVPMSLPTASAGSPDLTGFTPREVAKIYQASSLPAAENTSLAIVMMGDVREVVKNLRYAERKWNYDKVHVKVVYGGPKKYVTYKNPLSGNAEWDLDTQISTMEAESVKTLYLYDEQTFTDEDVARGMNSFVAQDKAVTGSASLGECDYIAWVDGAMLTTDQSLEEGALQGQSFFASTGDNGSFCPEGASTGVPGGGPGVSWPADGTWTAAAGGTTVVADKDGNVTAEAAWVGGGGGISPYETGGDWTIPANTAAQSNQFTNQGGRAVPDISAIADENTPVLIYTGDKDPEGIGGTSVSAPLLSGLWARLQGDHQNKLGVASVRFYYLYDETNPGTTTDGPTGPVTTPAVNPKPVPGFRDVVVGSNGEFTAKPGWDMTTGIGTPLLNVLTKRLTPMHIKRK